MSLHRPYLLLLLLIGACAGGREPLLNSERIEARYGSYAVTLLYQDDELRVSSLESMERGTATTRTLALVQYRDDLPASVRPLHARIAGGASIGATFRDAGWTIRKPTDFAGPLPIDSGFDELSRRMRIALPATLAVHAYRFVAVRGDERVDYATIIEIHHPDYLDAGQLQRLYGRVRRQSAQNLLARLHAAPVWRVD